PDLGIGADRRADDDEVGALHRRRRICVVEVAELQRLGVLPRLIRGISDGDGLGEVVPARTARDRGADQADADEAELVEQRVTHCVAAPFTKSSIAWAQAFTASSSAMVTRRQSGRT